MCYEIILNISHLKFMLTMINEQRGGTNPKGGGGECANLSFSQIFLKTA